MKGSVEQLGEEAQKLTIKYIAEGQTYQNVANQLNKKFDSEISPGEVRGWYSRNKFKIFSEGNLGLDLYKQHMNTCSQLNTLATTLWKHFYDLNENPELKEKLVECPKCEKRFKVQLKTHDSLLKTSNQILEVVKHVDHKMGRLKGGGVIKFEQNIINTTANLTKIIPELMHDAEKRGDIRILNRKKFK
jgi:hypothetical protein